MYIETVIGKHYSELPSPCLLLNLDALEHNIKIMQALADSKHCARTSKPTSLRKLPISRWTPEPWESRTF